MTEPIRAGLIERCIRTEKALDSERLARAKAQARVKALEAFWNDMDYALNADDDMGDCYSDDTGVHIGIETEKNIRASFEAARPPPPEDEDLDRGPAAGGEG